MTGTATNCRYCNKPLPEGKRGNQVYCNAQCQKDALARQWREKNPKSPLGAVAAGTVAEANDMRVCIDLLGRGFSVYRAAFPAMPYDIIAVDPGAPFELDYINSIATTTGYRTAAGTVTYNSKVDKRGADVVAVVLTDGSIVYKPEL